MAPPGPIRPFLPSPNQPIPSLPKRYLAPSALRSSLDSWAQHSRSILSSTSPRLAPSGRLSPCSSGHWAFFLWPSSSRRSPWTTPRYLESTKAPALTARPQPREGGTPLPSSLESSHVFFVVVVILLFFFFKLCFLLGLFLSLSLLEASSACESEFWRQPRVTYLVPLLQKNV